MRERLALIVLEGIGSRDDKDDIEHRVEIGVGDTRGEDQAS